MKQQRSSVYILLLITILFGSCSARRAVPAEGTVLKDVTLIDGKGGQPVMHMDILIQKDTIAETGKNLSTRGRRVVVLSGKTVMPSLISCHVHTGTLKGTTTSGKNYTRENIIAQLKQYGDYGVGNILVMGTDRPMLFKTGLRDSSVKGLLPGARLHSAGYGFGVPGGAPPEALGMDQVFRPSQPEEVKAMMNELADVRAEVVKIWVDDFGGKFKKMDPAVYREIIRQAHLHRLRVAAHAYYLSDVRKLIQSGVDIIGHSIRDSVIDSDLLQVMKARGVAYIPTLSLDEFAYIYARKPEWVNDQFFRSSLQPGVYEMITSASYQEKLRNSPDYSKNVAAFETALKNLKKIADAGILVAMGTDSGATPVRAQGFSEHLELELMVQAGLTPLQAITIATKNSAELLRIDQFYGTIEQGKVADLLIVDGNPAADIRNTRKITSVYKAGLKINRSVPGK